MDNKNVEFERKMEAKNNSVIVIKNIDTEDFTHNYGGAAYTLRAGEQLPLTYPVGMHLAKHLAMKILRKRAFKQGQANSDKKTLNLYTPIGIQACIDTIVIKEIQRPIENPPSEAEQEKEKIEALQKEFKDEIQAPAKPEIEKKEIIKTLKERGIKFDARASKEKLLELVIESEKNG